MLSIKTAEDFLLGETLLVDKPLSWTSFQVVNKLRWEIRQAFKIKKIKVGHAGTLDPLATGLLVICTGKMTKKIDLFQGQIKEYTGTIALGSTTPSYDLETEINQRFSTTHLTPCLIKETVYQFKGEIEQFPPIYSALKKDGKRLYEYARAGKKIEIESRKVSITEFEITQIDRLNVHFRIVCSKGTYLRSLAHDFGKALQCGGHLSSLRRTKIGNFSVVDAIKIEDFIEFLQKNA